MPTSSMFIYSTYYATITHFEMPYTSTFIREQKESNQQVPEYYICAVHKNGRASSILFISQIKIGTTQ